MPEIPITSTIPSRASIVPIERCMGRMESGIAGTGTPVLNLPPAPSRSKCTCQEPEAISQSEPVKKAGSAAEGCMASELGGCFAASPVSGIGVMRMELIAAPELRTSTVATPGMTLGVRMVTNSLYGPALTSSKTSLLPTWA